MRHDGGNTLKYQDNREGSGRYHEKRWNVGNDDVIKQASGCNQVATDIDWQHDRLRIRRSKSGRLEIFPLEPSVGNAIIGYLRSGRPLSPSRTLFLTFRAPYRALSEGHYGISWGDTFHAWDCQPKGYGPHGLRHACARHLLEAGHSLKEVGDHLGHRSPD